VTHSKNKIRLDQLLIDKKLLESRSKAKALILAGKVLVNEEVIDKAGTLISTEDSIRIKETLKYVSRGGLKLEKALTDFSINVKDKICVDIGASTGGFTDCLLQNGAKKVYAIDVGYGQLHWNLQRDKRVVRFDRENFRYFDLSKIQDPIDMVVMDVSFISILLLIPNIIKLFQMKHARNEKTLIALIKPQFEVGPKHVGKGGIVRDKKVREDIVEKIKTAVKNYEFTKIRISESPIQGADGNVEYLMVCKFEGDS